MDTMCIGARSGKVYTERQILVQQIRKTEEEIKTAGPIHKKDLRRHLRRLQTQLRIYDGYRRAHGKESA